MFLPKRIVGGVLAGFLTIACAVAAEPTPMPTLIPTPTPTATPQPTVTPIPTPTHEDRIVASYQEAYLQMPEAQRGDAYIGWMLTMGELCQSSESPVPEPTRQAAIDQHRQVLRDYSAKADEAGKHISEYRVELMGEVTRMGVRCGLNYYDDVAYNASPTPDLLTQQMEETVDAALYVTENEWRVPFPWSSIYGRCVGPEMVNRSEELRGYIDHIDLKVATTVDYAGSPQWHEEIQWLAEELETLLDNAEAKCGL